MFEYVIEPQRMGIMGKVLVHDARSQHLHLLPLRRQHPPQLILAYRFTKLFPGTNTQQCQLVQEQFIRRQYQFHPECQLHQLIMIDVIPQLELIQQVGDGVGDVE